ncbi:hypothetical protein FB451DRAFT_1213232 [Mycena latifolia]|nr:hypothetical protein FB451DRAFT_1213232 [Mycena latifolia]
MSRQASGVGIRMDSTICLTPAIALLNNLGDAFGTPFVPAISNTTLALVTAVQNVRRNKDHCIQLLKNVCRLLCAIINLHISSDTEGNRLSRTMNHVVEFTQTFHKIHTFVEAQEDGSRRKYLFRHRKTKRFPGERRVRVQQFFEVFKVHPLPSITGWEIQVFQYNFR